MKAYVVTAGEYSDYHIEAVFLDARKAYAYCERVNKKNVDEEGYAWDRRSVETYNISEEESNLTRLGVWATFIDDELNQFCLIGARFKQLTFEKHATGRGAITEGDIKLRKDETIDQFRERAKKIVIDRYFDWKLRRANDDKS